MKPTITLIGILFTASLFGQKKDISFKRDYMFEIQKFPLLQTEAHPRLSEMAENEPHLVDASNLRKLPPIKLQRVLSRAASRTFTYADRTHRVAKLLKP